MIGESVVHSTMTALEAMNPGIRVEPKEAAVIKLAPAET